MKSIIDKSEFTNFLRAGAILQTSADQFKLIWGPFSSASGALKSISDEKTTIYAPEFWDFAADKPGLCLKGSLEESVSRAELLSLLRLIDLKSAVIVWDKVATEFFEEQFEWSQKRFAAGDLVKTVPIIVQRGLEKIDVSKLGQALLSVLEGQHFGYTYGLWSAGHGFLGHTPELIADWSASDEQLHSVALAGTTSLGVDIQADLKIQEEHHIVVNDLTEVIKSFLPEVFLAPTTVLELKHLKHLMTKFSARVSDKSLVIAIAEKIHPSAALGIYPRKAEHYKIFSDFKLQQRRKQFAAPFGFLSPDAVRIVAGIRSFQFSEGEVLLYSGCGVTKQSVLLEELMELENKRNSVKKTMGFDL